MSFQWKDTLDSEGLEKSSQTILEEVTIESEQISDQDVMTYAKIIGIEPRSEKALLWIAKQGLLSNLPSNWIAVKDSSERIYFYNLETGESRWDHPLDTYYRKLAQIERNKLNKTKNKMSLANVHFLDDKLTLTAEISDSVESIQFELEEFNLETDDENSDQKTLDITDGGIEDVKQFEEIYNINLQKGTNRNDKFILSEKTNNEVNQTMDRNIKSVKYKTLKDLYTMKQKLENKNEIVDDNDEFLEDEDVEKEKDERAEEIEEGEEMEEIEETEEDQEVEVEVEEKEKEEVDLDDEQERIEEKSLEDIESNLELIKSNMNCKIESMKEELKILINEHKNEIQLQLEAKLSSYIRQEILKSSDTKQNVANEINQIRKEIDFLKIRMDGNDNDLNKWIKNQWKKMNETVEDIEKDLHDLQDQERFNEHNDLVLKSLRTEISKIDGKNNSLMEKLSVLINQSDKLIERIDKIEDKNNYDYKQEIKKDIKDLKNSLNIELTKIKSENEAKNEERIKLVEDNFKNRLEQELANLKDDYEIMKTYLQQEVDKIEQIPHEKDDFSLKERFINLENGIKQICDKLLVKNEEPLKTSNSESSQISLNEKACKCCKHCYFGNRSLLLSNENELVREPIIHSLYPDNYTHLKDIRASSLSLISLIQNTSKLLKEEAKQLESIGNYQFISDINTNFLHKTNSDEITVRRLKLIRNDIDEKLKKLDNILAKKRCLDE